MRHSHIDYVSFVFYKQYDIAYNNKCKGDIYESDKEFNGIILHVKGC